MKKFDFSISVHAVNDCGTEININVSGKSALDFMLAHIRCSNKINKLEFEDMSVKQAEFKTLFNSKK